MGSVDFLTRDSAFSATVDGLLGKPYVAGGRGPQAFDCLGLMLELFSREGFYVPDPYRTTMYQLFRWFRRVDGSLSPMDVLLQVRREQHVCTVVEPGWVLDIDSASDSVRRRIDDVRRYPTKAYRLKCLAQR